MPIMIRPAAQGNLRLRPFQLEALARARGQSRQPAHHRLDQRLPYRLVMAQVRRPSQQPAQRS
jgi:hypothetical protein